MDNYFQTWPEVKRQVVGSDHMLFVEAVNHCVAVPNNRVLFIGETNHEEAAKDFSNTIDSVHHQGFVTTYRFKNGSEILQRKRDPALMHMVSSMELGGIYVERSVFLDLELERFLKSRLRLKAASNDRRFVATVPTKITRLEPNATDLQYRDAVLESMRTRRTPENALRLDAEMRRYLEAFQEDERADRSIPATERIRENIAALNKWLTHYQRDSEEFVEKTSRVDDHAKAIKIELLRRALWGDLASEADWMGPDSKETLNRAIKAAQDELGDLCRDAVIKAKNDAQVDLQRVIISTNTFPPRDEDAE